MGGIKSQNMDVVLLEASLAAAIHNHITILGVSKSFYFAFFRQNRSAKKTPKNKSG